MWYVSQVVVARTVQDSSPALRVSWTPIIRQGIVYFITYSTSNGTQSTPPNTNLNWYHIPGGITSTTAILGPLDRGTTYFIWVAPVLSGIQGQYSTRVQQTTYDCELIFLINFVCNINDNIMPNLNGQTGIDMHILIQSVSYGVFCIIYCICSPIKDMTMLKFLLWQDIHKCSMD